MKYNLSKKIVQKIITKEIENTSIKVIFFPVNKYENIYDIIKTELIRQINDNQRTISETIHEITNNLKSKDLAIYLQLENKIKINLTRLKNYTIDSKDYLWNLVFSIYHEYKHALISNELMNISEFEINNLHNFYLLIDYLADEVSDCYEKNASKFYEEIIADIYGYDKTVKFLNKYPKLKQKLHLYIEKDRLITNINYQNYDVQRLINIFNKTIKNNPDKSQYFEKVFPYGIISILYNIDGKFKNLETLSNNSEWNKYPKEVKYLIISSKAYLDDINYTNITSEELEFILEALEYTYNLEEERYKNNQQLKKEISRFDIIAKRAVKFDKETFDYNESLFLILDEKERYNHSKLEYLDYQISKLTNLAHAKKLERKKIYE